MASILIFLILTVFFVVKLYQALGSEKHDTSKNNVRPMNPDDLGSGMVIQGEKKVIDPKEQDKLGEEKYGFVLWGKIKDIQKIDKSFSAEEFLEGAVYAFELIVKSFSKDDKVTLKRLIAEDLYKNLADEIDKRQLAGQKQETTIISMIGYEIIDIFLEGKKQASIKVRFETDQVLFIKDNEGNIIQGNSADIDRVVDVWTFRRNLSSSDPNWLLVETTK